MIRKQNACQGEIMQQLNNTFNKNGSYWDNKLENAAKARTHTQQMAEMYPNRIKRAVKESVIYGMEAKDPNPHKCDHLKITKNSYMGTDSVSALMKTKSKDKIAVLNYASYKNPGGMFYNGSSAQEESLCHSSFLYNVLSEFADYYAWNNAHKNRCMYQNRAIYTPSVVFAKDGVACMADVITCAAPNFKAGEKYCHIKEEENDLYLNSRIAFIRDIAETEGVDILIAGAYGCGVFGQNPQKVADCFQTIFEHTTLKEVIYAVPEDDNKSLYNALFFKRRFS